MDGSEQDEQPSVHPFAPARTPGAQLDFTKEYSPLELFQLTFSQSVVQTLCTNTNKKAQRRIDQGMKTPWSPLEPGELYRYFGVLISMGLVRCPETRDYWSRARCYSLPFPRTVFSRTRFEAISWALHISDPDTDGQNDALRGTDRYDRLFRLRPLIDEVVAACRSFYQPRQQLSIDERMVATKARIGFKQYMKAKPTKWGFKLFVLSDACNGYTCDFNVYTGKQKSPTGKGLSHNAVINLLTPYLGTGYQVYVDNWYTSTALFQELHGMRFGACGTCRENRKGYPVTKVNDMPRNAERGTVKWIRQGQMLYVKWMDTREVKMCSTFHMAFQGDTTVRNVRNTDGTWTSCRVPIPVSSLLHLVLFPVPPGLLLVVVLWVQLVDLVASQSLSVTLAQWIAPARRQQAGGDVFIALLMNHKMFLTSFLELVCCSLCVFAVRESSQSGLHTNKPEGSSNDHESWCYEGCEYTPSLWHKLSHSKCGGDRQSPINIDTSEVITDSSLGVFNFTNFSNPDSMKYLINTGHSVKCVLEENMVEIEGGGLSHKYSTKQFHFHSGNKLGYPGSEHLINEDRYPMEMHIVSLKKGLSEDQALAVPEGIAVLGFFINVTDKEATPEKWKNLTSYLINITEKNSTVDIKGSISIDDLLGDVNLTKFYRYKGSLTTPPCSEVVVWTIFQEPIIISRNMVELFIKTLNYVKVYRPAQDLNGRKVYASPGILESSGHSWCYDDHCEYSPSHWHMLPDSKCGGDRQSPINIDTKHVTYDQSLNNFTFTNFSNLHSMTYLTNTGHTVECELEDNMVEIEGGGLNHSYSTKQFHFHWGKIENHSNGSEHTVDSKRYPMEMHIVSSRKGLSVAEAVKDSEGLAVLGFFIEVTHEKINQKSWETLTSYLSHIIKKDSTVKISSQISIDDLLGDVDRSKYYRYKGSLTTPDCNEAVVWTVFKQPIKVNNELVKLFPSIMGYYDVYRPEQKLHSRTVQTSTAPTGPRPIPLPLLLSLLYVGCVWMGDK
ncbi:hypothetical protein SKAU_G00131570 [Synaphobranchus kaupii]|uniref:Carbonic anhydrase n=1 Tax=Synaphobranchus kaupii TaxID=118154 RepID=A0A9Q1J324_SYNKA|nr:hypothetical protein SKAU_G00131570 [Synaphobranchus kaupii]